MRIRLLYILIDAKGLSSTHRREEEWEKEEARGTERITSPEKIVPLSTDIAQFDSSSRVKNRKFWLYLWPFRPLDLNANFLLEIQKSQLELRDI